MTMALNGRGGRGDDDDDTELMSVGRGDTQLIKLGFFEEDPERFAEDAIAINAASNPTWRTRVDTWFSRKKSELTRWWVRHGNYQFGHVEMVLPTGLVCSTTERSGLHVTEGRLLSNKNYTAFLDVEVTREQAQRIEHWMVEHKGTPFNTIGRFWNAVPLLTGCLGPIDAKGREYYCSELIATVLKELAGKCRGLDPRCTNPTQLYLYLVRTGEGRASFNEAYYLALEAEGRAPPKLDILTYLHSGADGDA